MKSLPSMLSNLAQFLPENKQEVYLVGGSIRDHLLGLKPTDFDIISNRNIDSLAYEIAKKTGGKAIHINKGSYKILKISKKKMVFDVTQIQDRNLEANLLQRDFTINAIAIDLSNGNLFDPSNGLNDIKRKKIRMVTNSVFQKDPIRLIRAYRIGLKLGCSLTLKSKLQLAKDCKFISKVPGEKIWHEIVKIFSHHKSSFTLSEMLENGLLSAIFPELSQNWYHSKNRTKYNFKATILNPLLAYSYIESLLFNNRPSNESILKKTHIRNISPENRILIKYFMLINGLSKNNIPKTFRKYVIKTEKTKKIMAVENINKRLRLAVRQHSYVSSLLKNHFTLADLFVRHTKKMLEQKDKYQFFEMYGSTIIPTIMGFEADFLSNEISSTYKETLNLNRPFIFFLNSMLEQYEKKYKVIMSKPPLLTGLDLINCLKIAPSPKFKHILMEVNKARVFGKISTKKSAIKIAKHYAKMDD